MGDRKFRNIYDQEGNVHTGVRHDPNNKKSIDLWVSDLCDFGEFAKYTKEQSINLRDELTRLIDGMEAKDD
jgi:hypothetical protein